MIGDRDLSTVLVEKERRPPDLANHDRQTARRNAMSNTQRATVPETRHADDELLTMQEVADVVRVPVATLRYWRHLGTGPRSFRIGRSVRYWRTEVLACLDDQANSDRQSVI
jgi:predicted DNA-binding transcriptional regulator AlpA